MVNKSIMINEFGEIDKVHWRTAHNYYHFFVDFFAPFLFFIQKNNLNIENTFLHPNKFKHKFKFEYNSILKELGINQGFENMEIIHFDNKKVDTETIPYLIRFIDEYKVSRLIKKETTKKIVFIKRRKEKRSIINEEQLIKELKNRYTYEVFDVYFEDLSFVDQVNIVCGCNLLVGCHGAGFTNLLFMNENSNVLDLVPEHCFQLEGCYSKLCSLKNINYYSLQGKTPNLSDKYLEEYKKILCHQ